MVAGLDGAGVAVPAGAYLATFTFKATADAQGSFSVHLRVPEPINLDGRTDLFATTAGSTIEIRETAPALISISPRTR
jgi:hypothetical protein